MDHVLENKFLGKEAASKAALHEMDDGIEMYVDTKLISEVVQFQIFDSFVKEKHALLGYMRAIVLFSARHQGLSDAQLTELYPDALQPQSITVTGV